MYILGIESSCDETSAAIVKEDKTILSNIIYSQINEHKQFKGVVPEIAARAHLQKIDIVVQQALIDAGISIDEIDAIAGTCGPGLIGGIIVGATFAKTLAMCKDIPFIAVNHIEAHAISAMLTEQIEFPYLLLLTSGGHCQICVVYAIDNYKILGQTIDDSIGESFDKVASLLNLGYPGGPAIEASALHGNISAFKLPRPLCNKKNLDFSFSGLKTAVRTIVQQQNITSYADKCDLCASFQFIVSEILNYKMSASIEYCFKQSIHISAIVMAGGVAANSYIKNHLNDNIKKKYKNLKFYTPPINICTDNAAMIAWLGLQKALQQKYDVLAHQLHPRWPLSQIKIDSLL